MSKCWQLGALMKKNLILMKRSCCATSCEIVFPIILMLLLVAVRRAIAVIEYNEPVVSTSYLRDNSTAIISPEERMRILQSAPADRDVKIPLSWNGMTIRNNT